MKKIVIDTNILVSAAIGNGASTKILYDIIFDPDIEVCICENVLAEYNRVSEYNRIQKKYPLYRIKLKEMIESLQIIGVKYFPSQTFALIKDISDNKFLDLAYESKANYLITGNHKDFTISQFEETKILSPQQFCELYRQNDL